MSDEAMATLTDAATTLATSTSTMATSSRAALPVLYRPSAISATPAASASASASATAASISTPLESGINWFVLLIIVIPALFIVYAITKRILACFTKRKQPPTAALAQHPVMPIWPGYPPMQQMQPPPAAMMAAHMSPMQQMQYLAYQQNAPMQPSFDRAHSWDKQSPYMRTWEKR